MKKLAQLDRLVGLIVVVILLYSVVILLMAYFDGENLATWVWERHQNQFSWYSRPLFLIPACYYAFRQKFWLIIGFMAMLFCSLFWFAAPISVPEHVSGYLEWEKQLFFTSESVLSLLVLTFVVIVFLVALFSAFWHRNPWLGLALVNAGTILKIIVSIGLGKEAGKAAIVPSLSSLVVINLVAYVAWRHFANKE